MSNSNISSSNLGVTRVQHNVPDETIPEPSALGSGNHGSSRLVVDSNGNSHSEKLGQVHQYSGASHLAEARETGSILDSARNSYGGMARQISGDSIVMVEGMETSVANAVQLGYLRQNQDGSYVETGKATERPADEQQQEQQQGDSIELHPEALDVINTLIEPLPQSVYEGVIHKSINFGVDSLDFQSLGEQLGTTPEDAAKRVEFIIAAYRAPADRAVKAIVGNSVEEMYAWAAEADPKAHAEALTELVFGNNVAKLKALASRFMKSTNPDEATLKQGGFQTKAAADGTKLVNINGTWTSVAAAVKAGWI